VIEYLGSREESKESLQLNTSNDPRPGGHISPKGVGGEVDTRVVSELGFTHR
jgi:hypothetical protein